MRVIKPKNEENWLWDGSTLSKELYFPDNVATPSLQEISQNEKEDIEAVCMRQEESEATQSA